jgi:hypothetical protein
MREKILKKFTIKIKSRKNIKMLFYFYTNVRMDIEHIFKVLPVDKEADPC